MKTLLTTLSIIFSTVAFSQTSYVKYYKGGQLKEVGNFADSIYVGCVTRYYITGSVEFEGQYNLQGQEDGSIKYYYPNGQVQFEYFTVAGKITGEAFRYDQAGHITKVLHYKDGILVNTDLASIN